MTSQPGDPTYRTDRIRGALVADPRLAELYRLGASFKYSIDMLAIWLPMWVDAMAEQSLITDEALLQRAELMAASPFGTMAAHDPAHDPAHDNQLCSRRRHLAEVMADIPGCPVTCDCSCHQPHGPVDVDELRALRPGDVVQRRTSAEVVGGGEVGTIQLQDNLTTSLTEAHERHLADERERETQGLQPHAYVPPDADGAPCCPWPQSAHIHRVTVRRPIDG